MEAPATAEWNISTTEEPVSEPFDITGVLCYLIAAVGILGNGLVLFVFLKVSQLRVTSCVLIRNQAIVDFLSSVLLILLFSLPDANYSALADWNQLAAVIVCKVWGSQYVFWACIKVSTVNLVFITLERYVAVVLPHQYRNRGTNKNMLLVTLIIWFIGAVIELYTPIIHEVYEDGECSSRSVSENIRHVIAYVSLITTLVIPLMVMAFVYTSIAITLRPKKPHRPSLRLRQSDFAPESYDPSTSSDAIVQTLSKSLSLEFKDMTVSDRSTGTPTATTSVSGMYISERVTPGDQGERIEGKPAKKQPRQLSSRERARRNILCTMFLVCATYLVCWTPDVVLFFHHNVVRKHEWSDPFPRFVVLLAFSNVCTNPIIYTLKYRQFQRGLKTLFVRGTPGTSYTGGTV